MIETKTALCLDPVYPGSGFDTRIAPVAFSAYNRPVKNTKPNRIMTVYEAYLEMKGHRYQPQTAVLRSLTDKNIARNYKASNFDYVTFSGLFNKRCEAGLIQHSGLLTLDFDHVFNLQELKATLLSDPFLETVLMFTSPSGDGLKSIVSINLEEGSHFDWFRAIAYYIIVTYQLEVDPSGKDISRACFLCHDPDVYIHPSFLTSSISKPINSYNHEIN